MEDLLRSLRNLGLQAPGSSQLLELLDEDARVQQNLVKVLSLSSLTDELDEQGGGGGGVAALMGQELLQEAVKALLDNFGKFLQRQRQTAQREGQGGSKRVKWPPRKALLARQAAALQRSEREQTESHGYRPRLVFDGTRSFCSTSSVASLKRVGCADLNQAPKRYQGELLHPILLCMPVQINVPFQAATSFAE